MQLLSDELHATTIVSVGHRPELEALHKRKLVLEHRAGGARLVRAIAGLWPWGEGEVQIQGGSKLCLMPQRPYVPLGTLRRATVYPGAADSVPNEDVVKQGGIPLDMITGTSIGALVGSVYAILRDAKKTEERFRRFVFSREFRRTEFDFLKDSRENAPGVLYSVSNLIKRGIFYSFSMTRPSFISEENFTHNIHQLVEDVAIGKTAIEFYPVAVDLESGEEVVLTAGSLRRGVLASSAIPGLSPP